MPIFAYPEMSMKIKADSTKQIAGILKAIGHPVRIEIIRLLALCKSGTLSVKEIHGKLGLSQPEVSKHLIVLRKQSILTCHKSQGYSLYKINSDKAVISKIVKNLITQ